MRPYRGLDRVLPCCLLSVGLLLCHLLIPLRASGQTGKPDTTSAPHMAAPRTVARDSATSHMSAPDSTARLTPISSEDSLRPRAIPIRGGGSLERTSPVLVTDSTEKFLDYRYSGDLLQTAPGYF